MKVRKVFALSILATSIALAAGCSSDDDDDDDTDTMEPTDPTDPTDPDPTDPDPTDPDPTDPEPVMDTTTLQGESILDFARGTDDDEDGEVDEGTAFDGAEIGALLGAAGGFPEILNLLDDETAVLTVFAPTDEAFAALGDAAPTGDDLERVLQYHVISGTNIDASTIANSLTAGGEGVSFDTAAGAPLTASLSEDGTTVTITDGQGNEVDVVASDETPSNGTVHVIGSVLLPPDAEEEPGEGEGEDTDPTEGGGGEIVAGSSFAEIESNEELSEFEALVLSSNFREALQDPANQAQVIFAPKNGNLAEGVDTVVAYVHTNRAAGATGPVDPGTYAGTGAQALSFEVAGEGDSLTVNGLPAEYIETTSGAALYVYGGEEDGED